MRYKEGEGIQRYPLPCQSITYSRWRWGKNRVELKSGKIFSRREKSPTIKNYKILYSELEKWGLRQAE
jgi:hypothetical protein